MDQHDVINSLTLEKIQNKKKMFKSKLKKNKNILDYIGKNKL
jgi:hypothetical protein